MLAEVDLGSDGWFGRLCWLKLTLGQMDGLEGCVG